MQIVSPVVSMVGAFNLLVAAGAATSLSTCMGGNDVEAIRRTKNAVRVTMVLAAAIVAVVQFPIIYFIIDSYHLDPELRTMVWQYAFGMMIAFPIGIIESVGAYQLTILGKMRVLMILSLGEGIINLLLDLLFVGVMHLGVMGIGCGRACGNVLRCAFTLIYLLKKSDLLKRSRSGVHLDEVKDILRCGTPESTSMMMVALGN